MTVSDLAKQLGASSEDVLSILKSLKLKAKDGKQEVSSFVISVVKTEWLKRKPAVSAVKEVKVEKEVEKKAIIKDEKKVLTKSTKDTKEKTATVKSKVAEKDQEKEPLVAAKISKSVAKKTAKKEVEKVKETVKEVEKVKEAVKEVVKSVPRISKEPIITLKPLARKKKKMIGGREFSSDRDDHSSSVVTPDSASNILQSSSPDLVVAGQLHGEKIADLSAVEKNLQEIELRVPISVKDFAPKVGQKPSIILKELMKMGILANINQNLDAELAAKLATFFGYKIGKIRTQEEQLIEVHKKEKEDPKFLKARAPVVTFMGHVDHGKTSLLDKIRKSRVADKEHGGITQHMGAYSVQLPKGRITFLDTPGHEAFTAMRARGAHITDLVVLVVAADEGIMPQTLEAINHAKAAEVPIIVAINKIDHRNADVDRIKKQLMEIGLMAEDWGGKTSITGVSALTGEGIDNLLEIILLEAELLELKANFDKKASGIVVDAHLSQGRGVVTTLIVQSGILKEGDVIVIGRCFGKIKAMFNDFKESLKEAGPSMPVEILGLSDVPEAGDVFYVVEDEKHARDIALQKSVQMKNDKLNSMTRISLEDLYSQIQQGKIKELNIIIKADVQGSLEALKDSLEKIPNEKIRLKCIHLGVGEVNTSDILLAVASKAVIIAFHVGTDQRAKKELEKEAVDLRQYRIIYDAVNDMRNAMEGLLDAKTYKRFISRVEIRQVFSLSKSGTVAGCYVTKGRINRKALVDVMRDQKVIFSGHLSSLKRFKDDVKDVAEGTECGITIAGFDKIQPGDLIEAYEIESVAQKL